MAFGNEMKDFIAAFQVGYSMFKSKDEKEWEAEERQMKRDSHQWDNEDRSYRRERDAESDRRWYSDDEYRRSRAGRSDFESDRNHDWNVDQSGRNEGWREFDRDYKLEDLEIRRNQLKLNNAKDRGAIPDYDPGSYQNPYQGSFVDPMNMNMGVDSSTTGSIPRATPASASVASGAAGEAAGRSAGGGGASQRSYLQYANSGATRNKPVSEELASALEKVLPGLGVQAKVFSGGQDAKGKGTRRTGSTRHDYGNAADVFFYKDGRKLDWSNPNDRPIFQEIVRRGRQAGITGFGAGDGYMQRGSMHIGFGKPGVWGKGGKGDNAPNWLREAYYGGRSQNVARGGLIAALPEEDEDLNTPPAPGMAVEVAQAPEMALPEEGPMPTPRYEGGIADEQDSMQEVLPEDRRESERRRTNDRWEAARQSVRDGMQRATERAGFDINSAIDDPELEKMRQNYLRGYGATPAGMMKQVLDKIDPDKKMRPGERNMAAMAEVYQFYVSRGDEEQAKEAAASMVQYYRRSFQQFSALARAALEKGDLDNASKAAIAAYANIPNGRDLSVEKLENGQYEIRVTDMETGDVVTDRVMHPREFGALAMGFNPAMFEDELLAAAGAAPREQDRISTSEMESAAETVRSFAEDYFAEEDRFNDKEKTALRDIAVDLAGNKENALDAERALRMAVDFMEIDQATDEEGRLTNLDPNFSAKKIPNSDLWEINFYDRKFEVTSGTKKAIDMLRAEAVKRATDENERSVASRQARDKAMEDLRTGIGIIGENLRGGSGAVDGREYVSPQEAIPMINPDPIRSPFAQEEPDDPSYVPEPGMRERNPYYPPGR